MKRLTSVLTLATLLLTLAVGCHKNSERPADPPPDMTPTKITITQEGKPLEGASVMLKYNEPVKYPTSGITDENGVATMVTYGFAGAQQGTAKVIVLKLVTEGETQGEEYGKNGDYGTDFHVVDAKYRSEETTDLEITIGSKNVKETFDVGAPVHEK